MMYWLSRKFVSLIQVFLLLRATTWALTLKEVKIPQHIDRWQTAKLECQFKLNNETLYSVKWYKDGHEFYRFLPGETPPAIVFPVSGINVDVKSSTGSEIVLNNVDLSSSGRYRCEVSGEAPHFQTVTQHGDMEVVAMPEQGPELKLIGNTGRYAPGDILHANCTSSNSKPAAHLRFLIDGEEIGSKYLIGPFVISNSSSGLETVSLVLNYQITSSLSQNSEVNLSCEAKIATMSTRSARINIELENPIHSNHHATRADKVRAANSSNLRIETMLLFICLVIIALS